MTEIYYPTTPSQVIQLLRRPGRSALLGGGSKLLAQPREQLDAVLSLRDMKLDSIDSDGDVLHIGATTRLQSIVEAEACRGVLAQAAHDTASLHVRSSATLGGTLMTASAASPLPVALLALDGTLTVYAPEMRHMPLDGFLNYRERLSQESLLITGIHLPLRRLVARAAYDKVARTPSDAPIVCVVSSARGGSGPLTDVRLAVGGGAPSPIRLLQVEHALEGQPLNREQIEQAGELAARLVNPPDNPLASPDYARAMVRVLVERTLRALRA